MNETPSCLCSCDVSNRVEAAAAATGATPKERPMAKSKGK